MAIDHTLVPSDQSDFPIVIADTLAYLKSVGNGGEVESASGFDIVLAADAAGATIFDFERVSWDPATGKVELWCKIPSLSSSVDTTIYLLSGNAAVTTEQANPSGVWTAYSAVYHLPDGTTLNSDDSTGTNSASQQNSPVAAAGQIDGAASFPSNLAAPHLNAGTDASIEDLATGNVTFEFWINSPITAGFPVAITKGNWATSANKGFIIWPTRANPGGTTDRIQFEVLRPYPNTARWAAAMTANTWTHVVIVYNGGYGSTDALLYLNGALASTIGFNAGSGSLGSDAGEPMLVGGDPGYSGSYLNGKLDEIRISRTLQTADYAATSFNNQTDPSLAGPFFGGTPSSPPSPLTWTYPSASGKLGKPFSAQVLTDGGTPPLTFILLAGELPPGLSLNSSSGVISGTPGSAGRYKYTVLVTGS